MSWSGRPRRARSRPARRLRPVLLWAAHSIRSEIPWLFQGRLPDLNIGTAGGQADMREEQPYDWIEERAGQVQPVVRSMMEAALQACRKLHG